MYTNCSSTYSRRELLKSLAAFSATMAIVGCNKGTLGSSAPISSQPAGNVQPTPSGPIAQASLSVSSSLSASLGAGFAGLSYEKSAMCESLFSADNADLIGLFGLLGPSVLRIGGNSVDHCVWTPDGAGQTAGKIAPPDVDALSAFLSEAGWQCIYGINLGGAADETTTPELAAAEVAYVSKQLGSSLVGIEIGNECDGYGAAGSYFPNDWSLAQFQSLWNEFRAAIVAAVPGVSIVGPASGSNVSTWTIPFSEAIGHKDLSQLTQHYYRGDGTAATSTAAKLISPDANLTNCLAMLSAGTQSTGIPFRIGECNSYFNGGAVGVSDSYASSLWVIDFLFSCAAGGAAGVNLHGGGNYGGYTPIADDNGSVIEARPEFYGMVLFTLAGKGTLRQTNLSADGINATAYSVEDSSGNLNVVIVNKDATQNLQLTLSLPQSIGSASLLEMTQLSAGAEGPRLAATSGVTIQGASISAGGEFSPSAPYSLSPGSQLTCYAPALSAVLIQTRQ